MTAQAQSSWNCRECRLLSGSSDIQVLSFSQVRHNAFHMNINHCLLSNIAHQDSNIFLVVLKQVFGKNGWAFCVTHNTVVAYPVFCGRNTLVALVSSFICFLIQALARRFELVEALGATRPHRQKIWQIKANP